MTGFKVGETYEDIVRLVDRHSAEFYGNKGVDVAATPALIAMLEVASDQILRRHLTTEQGTVGIRVCVDHLGAAPIDVDVVAAAVITEIDGVRVSFDVEAKWGDTVLMKGTHQRAVVELERFLANLPKRPE